MVNCAHAQSQGGAPPHSKRDVFLWMFSTSMLHCSMLYVFVWLFHTLMIHYSMLHFSLCIPNLKHICLTKFGTKYIPHRNTHCHALAFFAVANRAVVKSIEQ